MSHPPVEVGNGGQVLAVQVLQFAHFGVQFGPGGEGRDGGGGHTHAGTARAFATEMLCCERYSTRCAPYISVLVES